MQEHPGMWDAGVVLAIYFRARACCVCTGQFSWGWGNPGALCSAAAHRKPPASVASTAISPFVVLGFSFWFSGCWRARGHLPKARRGRVFIAQFTITTFVVLGALHRALRRMAGLVFLLGFLGAGGRLPKERHGRGLGVIHHHHHHLALRPLYRLSARTRRAAR